MTLSKRMNGGVSKNSLVATAIFLVSVPNGVLPCSNSKTIRWTSFVHYMHFTLFSNVQKFLGADKMLKIFVSFVIAVSIIIFNVTIILRSSCSDKVSTNDGAFYDNYRTSMDFENFDNVSGTRVYIVPNIVHLIKFGKNSMTFIEAVCILAALKNQRPDKLVIHTDEMEQSGRYWDIINRHPLAQGVIEVKYLPQPNSIFGQELSEEYRLFHAGDVARLKVLMTEGGIYLDGDSYIVRSLNEFRSFEMTLGWQVEGGISNQVIIAHKHARFLAEWYSSYRSYKKHEWFYNAGEKPTEILRQKPYLIHRVHRLMAEWVNTEKMIYLEKSIDWTSHYAIHLLVNHQYIISKNLSHEVTYPVIFDEDNILNYDANIKDMVLAVYPHPSKKTNLN